MTDECENTIDYKYNN